MGLVTPGRLARLTGRLRRFRLPRFRTRHVVVVLALGAAATGFVAFVLPQIAGAGEDWRRVRHGNAAWLAAAATAEIPSYAGYVVLLRMVFGGVVEWRESFLITMAGVAATRLLATAGAGGIALTSWALGRLGLGAHAVARGMVAFLAVLYGVYMLALLTLGLGLGTGVLSGGGSAWLTLVPAVVGAGAIASAAAVARAPGRVEQRLAALAVRTSRVRRPFGWFVRTLHDTGEGVRLAFALIAHRPMVAIAAVAWWGFDIAALGASFHAFGGGPAVAVLVMGYFVGMLGNLLPLPGGVGGVEGGMIGAFVAFGQSASVALVAVLGYRLVSFWLPTLIGAPAYVALRRALAPEPG